MKPYINPFLLLLVPDELEMAFVRYIATRRRAIERGYPLPVWPDFGVNLLSTGRFALAVLIFERPFTYSMSFSLIALHIAWVLSSALLSFWTSL